MSNEEAPIRLGLNGILTAELVLVSGKAYPSGDADGTHQVIRQRIEVARVPASTGQSVRQNQAPEQNSARRV
jgi:hypothetical protein